MVSLCRGSVIFISFRLVVWSISIMSKSLAASSFTVWPQDCRSCKVTASSVESLKRLSNSDDMTRTFTIRDSCRTQVGLLAYMVRVLVVALFLLQNLFLILLTFLIAPTVKHQLLVILDTYYA